MLTVLMSTPTGVHFHDSLRKAFSMKAKHEAIFEDFNKTFPADVIAKWKVDVKRWEVDPMSKLDPFLDDTEGLCALFILVAANSDGTYSNNNE